MLEFLSDDVRLEACIDKLVFVNVPLFDFIEYIFEMH